MNRSYKTIPSLAWTIKHISQALKDKREYIRYAAIRHPKATVKHISQALKDEDWFIRSQALQHPNATVEHVIQALNDENQHVRKIARKRLKEFNGVQMFLYVAKRTENNE